MFILVGGNFYINQGYCLYLSGVIFILVGGNVYINVGDNVYISRG